MISSSTFVKTLLFMSPSPPKGTGFRLEMLCFDIGDQEVVNIQEAREREREIRKGKNTVTRAWK